MGLRKSDCTQLHGQGGQFPNPNAISLHSLGERKCGRTIGLPTVIKHQELLCGKTAIHGERTTHSFSVDEVQRCGIDMVDHFLRAEHKQPKDS